MPPRIAAVIGTYYPYSHADVIVTKFLKGFPTDDHGRLAPRVKLTDAYLDQVDRRDMGLPMLWRNGATVHQSIRAALTGGDGKELTAEGVLMIGEHGDYPYDEMGRHMYPRKYFLEQICGVFAETGKTCPVFCDKHLSYNWRDAKWMYDRALEMGFPFMAGSSLPVGYRRPWLELRKGCRIGEAVTLGYGGAEAYGYHTIETLQCMVERRAGGETGLASVEYREGDAVWRAIDDGTIDKGLVETAVECMEDRPDGHYRDHCKEPMAFLFHYRDGLKASCVMLNGYIKQWGFAAHVDGEVQACEVHLQSGYPHSHFNYLSLNIEEMFVTGKPSYPVERTLMSTGMTNFMMVSKHVGKRIDTPEMEIVYEAPETIPWRTMHPRPTGANLEMWPPIS